MENLKREKRKGGKKKQWDSQFLDFGEVWWATGATERDGERWVEKGRWVGC